MYFESGGTYSTSHQLVLMVQKVNGQPLTSDATMFRSWVVQGDSLTLSTTDGGVTRAITYTKLDFYNSGYF